MAVLELARAGLFIDNNLTVLGLPPTGPAPAPNHKLPFGYTKPSAANTTNIINLFNTRYENRMDRQCCPIDGGTA